VPSAEEEDAKRPSRERESLVGERTRIVNRMKGALARLGIRGFKPELRRAPQRLEALRTPEELPIPPNMLEEFRRDLARLAMVRELSTAEEYWSARRSKIAAAGSRRLSLVTATGLRLVSDGVARQRSAAAFCSAPDDSFRRSSPGCGRGG
jgi:transposase